MFSKKSISVGKVMVGGLTPVSIQTMTNTNTEDVKATLQQIQGVLEEGCDIIRISCPSKGSTMALKEIIKEVDIPIVADIHFDYRRALEAMDAGVHCIRINPGNISCKGISEIVACAKNNKSSIRIGVNSGSIDREILEKYKEPCCDAIVESAVLNVHNLEDLGFDNFKISVKSSDVKNTIESYRRLSKLVDYPLHLGVTESGPVFSGTVKSAIGIGSLLADGIGDTIRVSLSTKDIVEEVKVAKQILKSLKLYDKGVNVISCPTCSRTLINVIEIANKIENLTHNTDKKLNISILGCVVNGPGEAMESDIGVFGFQEGVAKIYVSGKERVKCSEEEVMLYIEKFLGGLG